MKNHQEPPGPWRFCKSYFFYKSELGLVLTDDTHIYLHLKESSLQGAAPFVSIYDLEKYTLYKSLKYDLSFPFVPFAAMGEDAIDIILLRKVNLLKEFLDARQ